MVEFSVKCFLVCIILKNQEAEILVQTMKDLEPLHLAWPLVQQWMMKGVHNALFCEFFF